MDAAFEFFQKIRAPFWCFHDRDIAPEGRSLAASNRNLDQVVAHALTLYSKLVLPRERLTLADEAA